MASSPSSTPGKQLRLKDFLKEEENCPSYSCGGASGHRNPPPAGQPEQTVRYLLAMELREGAGGKTPRRRTRAVAALHRITEAINAIMVISPVSFSNGRLRRSSRRKREKERHPKENERITMIGGRNLVQQRSSGKEAKDSADMENLVQFPLSTVRNADSSTSSTGSGGGGGGDWSNTESAESDSSSSPVSPIFCGGDEPTTPTGRREPLAIKGEETEDGGGQGFPNCGKETDQLSPVSVLDFPYDDDEAAANFERTKQKFLLKLRRAERLPAPAEPADLEPEPASAEDDQLVRWAFALLWELERRLGAAPGKMAGRSADGLLLDFFVEGLTCAEQADAYFHCGRRRSRKKPAENVEEGLLRTAEAWVFGHQPGEGVNGWLWEWGEMEWAGTCFHEEEEEEEEEEEIAGVAAAGLLESFFDELILELSENRTLGS